MNENLNNIYTAILKGDMEAAQTEVRAAVDAGIPGAEILNTAMIPAMSEVGCMFEKEEYFVPAQVYPRWRQVVPGIRQPGGSVHHRQEPGRTRFPVCNSAGVYLGFSKS